MALNRQLFANKYRTTAVFEMIFWAKWCQSGVSLHFGLDNLPN